MCERRMNNKKRTKTKGKHTDFYRQGTQTNTELRGKTTEHKTKHKETQVIVNKPNTSKMSTKLL